MGKIYQGIRDTVTHKAIIHVDGITLQIEPSLSVKNYAPEYEFGYHGSGPSQTALAILFDLTGDKELTLTHHQAFKYEFIATTDYQGFIIIECQIREWLDKQLRNTEE